MKVIYDEVSDTYKIVRITGPKHNFLGLKFSKLDGTLQLIDLEEREIDNLFDIGKLRKAVINGINEANKKFNKDIKVLEIYYVSSDSKFYDVYTILTLKIIEYFLSQK